MFQEINYQIGYHYQYTGKRKFARYTKTLTLSLSLRP